MYLQVTVLDHAPRPQLHSSFQQAVGDGRTILQELGLLQGTSGNKPVKEGRGRGKRERGETREEESECEGVCLC